MKKYVFIALASYCLATTAQEDTLKQDSLTVINLTDLKPDSTTRNLEDHAPQISANTAIEIDAQTKFTVNLNLSGDLFEVSEEAGNVPLTIQTKQKVYVRFLENELLFSHDLTTWEPFASFFTGNISANAGIQDGEALITISSAINFRS